MGIEQIEKITVLSGTIPLFEVSGALLEHGIVVLETMRNHAKTLAKSMEEILGVNPDDEDGPYLIHLSVQVGDRGWSDFLVYSAVAEYQPEVTQEAVQTAVLSWVEAGCPDKHVAVVTA